MFYKKIADIAFKQDRERFFKEADKYEMIPYLVNSLSESEKQELAEAKETWRNMTDLPDYPDIDFPLAIPSFIKVKTFSTHKKGEDVEEQLEVSATTETTAKKKKVPDTDFPGGFILVDDVEQFEICSRFLLATY